MDVAAAAEQLEFLKAAFETVIHGEAVNEWKEIATGLLNEKADVQLIHRSFFSKIKNLEIAGCSETELGTVVSIFLDHQKNIADSTRFIFEDLAATGFSIPDKWMLVELSGKLSRMGQSATFSYVPPDIDGIVEVVKEIRIAMIRLRAYRQFVPPDDSVLSERNVASKEFGIHPEKSATGATVYFPGKNFPPARTNGGLNQEFAKRMWSLAKKQDPSTINFEREARIFLESRGKHGRELEDLIESVSRSARRYMRKNGLQF